MKFINSRIEKAHKNNELVCVCLNNIHWDKRLIGYVTNIHTSDKFELEIIDEFGEIKNVKTIAFASVKSLEIGGIYNENLEKLNKKGFEKNLSKPNYISAKHHNLFEKMKRLKEKQTLCTFFFNTEFSIGIVKEITQRELSIANIAYDGAIDGVSFFDIARLTKIRYGSNFENRIFFLYKNL